MKIQKSTRKLPRYTNSDKKNFLFIYLLILVPIIQFLIFWVFINFRSILISFQDDNGAWTIKNFKDVFSGFGDFSSEYNIPIMVGRSLLIWSVGHLISFPISIISTYVLYKRVAGHYAFRIIYMLPGLIGGVLWTSMVSSILNCNGIVVYIMKAFGYNNEIVLNQGLLRCADTAFPTLLIVSILTGIVGGNVVATGAFTKIPPELLDAGKIDGLDFWGSFLHIALPCAWPTISTLITLSLCGIFVSDLNIYIYTNGTGSPACATMGFYLYKLTVDISKNPGAAHYGYVAAIGLTITVVTIPIVLLGRKLINSLVPTMKV